MGNNNQNGADPGALEATANTPDPVEMAEAGGHAPPPPPPPPNDTQAGHEPEPKPRKPRKATNGSTPSPEQDTAPELPDNVTPFTPQQGADGGARPGTNSGAKSTESSNSKANKSEANGAKANGAAEPKPDIPNPFDPEAFRMPPEGEPGSGVEVKPGRLKIRKPKKSEFFRCHPTLRLMASIYEKEIEDAIDKLYFMATPAVAVMNPGEFKLVELCLCVNREGTQFVWQIPQPNGSGKANEWGVTAREGADLALTKWVRLKPDMAGRQYTVIVAKVPGQDPAFQPMTLQDMLQRTFAPGEFIRDEDHPVMKTLRGE